MKLLCFDSGLTSFVQHCALFFRVSFIFISLDHCNIIMYNKTHFGAAIESCCSRHFGIESDNSNRKKSVNSLHRMLMHAFLFGKCAFPRRPTTTATTTQQLVPFLCVFIFLIYFGQHEREQANETQLDNTQYVSEILDHYL